MPFIIYKVIIGPHLVYRNILYDQPNSTTFYQKNELAQYKVALAITGAIQGTFQERLIRYGNT